MPLYVGCLAGIAEIDYGVAMSMLLRHITRYVTQKIASDPQAKEKAIKVAHGVVDEAKQIAKQEDRAYAAGRAVRRAFDKLLSDRRD